MCEHRTHTTSWGRAWPSSWKLPTSEGNEHLPLRCVFVRLPNFYIKCLISSNLIAIAAQHLTLPEVSTKNGYNSSISKRSLTWIQYYSHEKSNFYGILPSGHGLLLEFHVGGTTRSLSRKIWLYRTSVHTTKGLWGYSTVSKTFTHWYKFLESL